MAKKLIGPAVILVVTGVAFIGGGAVMSWRGGGATTRLLSPDERFLAVLRETPALVDRNFRVEITRRDTDTSDVVFTSPDEGLPTGSERFIWGSESQYVLLVGRHFHVVDGARKTERGEAWYLLCDAESGRVWSNAAQMPDVPRIDEAPISRERFPRCADGETNSE